jgi:RNA polymerase sigma-70 factor (ECF subfamily)
MPEEPTQDDAQAESGPCEAELISRILAGEKELFENLVRRYNSRIYHISRAVVQSDDEAEDVVQEAFVRAFEHLREFEGRAHFSTWLTRIALHEALSRIRRLRRETAIAAPEAIPPSSAALPDGQERRVLRDEVRKLLEAAIDALPERYRLVFVMRHLEEMSTSETATCLGISEESVKVRLVRARTRLRQHLAAFGETGAGDVFLLLGARCDRVTGNVLARIAAAVN